MYPEFGLEEKMMIKLSAKQKELIKTAAFIDELEKLGAIPVIGALARMFGGKALKKAVRWAGSKAVQADKVRKRSKKFKPVSGDGLN